ncbi:MAG: hypothetical protein MUP21_08680 [Dehalococcoidia bacterium]|nr:hypothetical protein [Dehalococcoidia bacterium]
MRGDDWDEINVLIAGDNALVRGDTGRILGKEREREVMSEVSMYRRR